MAKTRSETVEQSSSSPAEGHPVDDETETSQPRWWWARLLPELVAIGLCVPLWVVTSGWTSSVGGPGPAFYPRMLIGLLVLGLLVRIFHEVRAFRSGRDDDAERSSVGEEGDAEFDASRISGKRLLVVIALSVGYVYASLWIGWIFATFVLVVVFLAAAGKRNPVVVLPLAAALSLGMAYVFVKIVYISLPTGYAVFDTATFRILELMGAA